MQESAVIVKVLTVLPLCIHKIYTLSVSVQAHNTDTDITRLFFTLNKICISSTAQKYQ